MNDGSSSKKTAEKKQPPPRPPKPVPTRKQFYEFEGKRAKTIEQIEEIERG